MDKKLLRAVEKNDAGLLSKLVSGGVSVHGVDKKGNSLLHLAALANSVEACAILIAGGIDQNIRNKKSETAAMLAESKKKKKVAQYLREQSEAAKNKPSAAAAAAPTPAPTSNANNSYPPNQISAAVNVLTYDINASEWEPTAEDTPLTLNFTETPFGFTLTAAQSDGNLCINDQLDASFVFSKSTDDFYNYRLGEGPIYGFQFVGENFNEFVDVMDNVLPWIENPPQPRAPEKTLPPAVPVPPAASTPEPEAPPTGGPPAPPEVGPPPPPPPPAVKTAANPVGGSLEDMLNAKKEKLADSNTEKPTTAPVTGGNMMSELQKRLQRRAVVAEPKEEQNTPSGEPTAEPVEVKPKITPVRKVSTPAAKSFVPVETTSVPRFGRKASSSSSGLSSADMDLFKNALLSDFRAELNAIKTDIISTLQIEISNVYAQ
mmetsp:Transcript_131865/g.196531  ORF Transcript_131865/g.196531 Transcript_131865/m.196531 type:complete len:432 (-) Transcript_131865:54-1349(-)